MNNCVLMAEIVKEPQLRYTSDNQMPIAEMEVQFEALRDDDPPGKLKVIGWGNLAQEIQQNYQEGDRVLLEGRLGMIRFDRPEGFKETRPELTVQRIHKLGSEAIVSSSSADPQAPVATSAPDTTTAPAASAASTVPVAPAKSQPKAASKPKGAAKPAAPVESEAPTDYDEIPF
jgi:single-strand DNA-binding protein